MITIYLDGRLGNQMFQYSVCRIIAEKNNYNFFIPNGTIPDNDNPHVWLGESLFECSLGKTDNSISNSFKDNREIRYDDSVYKVRDNTTIFGFFQSEKYFQGYEDKVRGWFKLKFYETPSYDINKYCFIHFRGGDYKTIPQYLLPIDYYETAKKRMLEMNKDLKFVIVTDDISFAQQYFPNDIIISNNKEIDFSLLYNAKYLIISNSSFSWWAGWLNENNNVIAPNNWFNYNTPEKGFGSPDIKTGKFIYV